MQIIGYWYSKYEPQYPMPVHSDTVWARKEEFISKLKNKQNKLGPNGRYRGWSDCRCCGKHNGSVDYTNGRFIWPEGYLHYVEDHNIVPPQEFIDYVLGAKK